MGGYFEISALISPNGKKCHSTEMTVVWTPTDRTLQGPENFIQNSGNENLLKTNVFTKNLSLKLYLKPTFFKSPACVILILGQGTNFHYILYISNIYNRLHKNDKKIQKKNSFKYLVPEFIKMLFEFPFFVLFILLLFFFNCKILKFLKLKNFSISRIWNWNSIFEIGYEIII